MFVEQVRHHPPHVSNAKYGVKLNISLLLPAFYLDSTVDVNIMLVPRLRKPSLAISGSSIVINNIGHMSLRLDTYYEENMITLCPGVVRSLIAGHPYLDLAGDITIHSSSGFTSHAHTSGKGWLSGKRHSINATVHANGSRMQCTAFKALGWMSSA